MMTANGKVLQGGVSEKGLAEFNALPEAERRPNKLAPLPIDVNKPMTPPAGGLVARQYLRYLGRDAKGNLCRWKDGAQQKSKAVVLEAADASGPNRDFLWLTAAEWQSLVPAEPVAGQRLPVRGAIAKRLFVYHLYDGTTGCGFMWQPDHLRAGELTLTVEEVSAGRCRMRLDGSARLQASAEWKADFRLLGYLGYDRQKKAFDRFDVVAVGECWNPSNASVMKQPLTLGLAFELAPPGSSGYGCPPYKVRLDEGKQTAYFALRD
jgi:hypothetical protein